MAARPNPNPIRLVSRAAALEDEIERLQAKLKLVQAMPQDEYETGGIVVFEKKFNKTGITYTYAAVKGGGLWYLSGNAYQFTWEQLLDKIYGDLGSGGSVSCYWVNEITPVV